LKEVDKIPELMPQLPYMYKRVLCNYKNISH